MARLTFSLKRAEPLSLPQELTDQIIDYLHHDLAALKHCSLVCRSWLFSSRIHLFRELVFTPKSAFVLPTLITTPPCSTIPPYVRKIEFQGVGHLFDSHCADPHLLCHFSSTVTHLHLRDITFESFCCVLDVICAFPYLQSLQLDHVVWGKPKNPQFGKGKSLPSSIVHLRLKHIPLQQFVTWLLSHPNLPKVPRLEIGPIEDKDVPYAGRYMSLIGPEMQYLSYSFGMGESGHMCLFDIIPGIKRQDTLVAHDRYKGATPASHYKRFYGLSTCPHLATYTSLRFLRIDGFVDFSSLHNSTATFWAPRILASIKPYDLNHIVLGLKLSRAGDLDGCNVNWCYFDYVIASDNYTNLRRLEFEVTGKVQLDGVANLLALRLPAIASLGILSVSIAP